MARRRAVAIFVPTFIFSHPNFDMAPTIQNCCFLITGAVLGALIPSTVPYILELLPYMLILTKP